MLAKRQCNRKNFSCYVCCSCQITMARRILGVLGTLAASAALTLKSSSLTVQVDDVFPRPLNYTHSATGETLHGALTGWGFHVGLSVNKGQITCGEAAMSTAYELLPFPPGSEAVAFSTTAGCVVNWASESSSTQLGARAAAPAIVTLTLNGTITVADDAAVAGAGVMTWSLTSASSDSSISVTTIDVAGMEVLSFRPVPVTPSCMYAPTDNGVVPMCGGDSYYVDSWSNAALDEWYSGTWTQSIETGTVDSNTPAGTNQGCIEPQLSRFAAGPYASVIAGGWSATGGTGAAVISSQKHAPFWTGPRAYDLPGRCSVFTIAPASIHASYLCGNGLPYTLTVGVFPDVTQDGNVTSDDIFLWRRMQYPRADVLYRTTLPYKIQIDLTSYNPGWTRIPFVDVLDYVSNISLITDGYPQTPILVGWQGLGHDTLYPGWDTISIRPDVGGAVGLQALAAGVVAASRNNRTSLSYHVNADEAYSLFNSAPNPSFDPRICRVNTDHSTPWFMNCTTTNFQTPDCGIRCSISKTKDNVYYGRYDRYARFFDTVPSGMRTIHSDAWRDVGASWEPEESGGFIDWANEQRCGSQADSAFWASHGMSMGIEGNDGQAAELMGTVSFLYHASPYDGWSPYIWGRLVYGTTNGWDLDVYCNNPGGRCTWTDMANNYYLAARVYHLAMTDELLGTTTASKITSTPAHATANANSRSRSSSGSSADPRLQQEGVHRFMRGGRMHTAHTRMHLTTPTPLQLPQSTAPDLGSSSGDIPQPSTWPYGGDVIPILQSSGAALLPLVMADGSTLDPDVLHAYQQATSPLPDASCPLYSQNSSVFVAADNTALSNWNGVGPDAPYDQFELDPSLPLPTVIATCNGTCWGNASCVAWDLIKVTGNSGRTKPLCMLFAVATGCDADPNQVAGVKVPLPVPPLPAGVNQTWTLPLSWVGSTVTAVTISPQGEVPGKPDVIIAGRNLTLAGVVPGLPVRLTRSS